jgi:CARDB
VTDAFTSVTAATRNLAGTALAPTTLKAGKKGKITLTLTNGGNVAISSPVEIAITGAPNGNLLAREAIDSVTKKIVLKAGQTKKVVVSYAVPAGLAAGQYSIVADLDTTNAIAETDETDNLLDSPVVTTVS